MLRERIAGPRAPELRSLLGILWPRAGLLVAPLLILLCVPMLNAERSAIGSDESLYLSEALNIANGSGPVYTTGEPVTHRAPLYPLLMAAGFLASDTTVENAYWIPRIAIIANVLLIFLLARAMFGPLAGLVAATLAAASPYLRGLGTTAYLDGVQTSFILASLLLIWEAQRGQNARFYGLAGVLLGAAFLIKESAVLLLPLPIVLSLLLAREPGWQRGLLLWLCGFGVTTGWWWLWVLAANGTVFLVGAPDSPLTIATLIAGLGALIILAAYLRLARESLRPDARSRVAGGLLTLIWGAGFLYGLDSRGYAFDSDYLRTVPTYLATVFAGNVQPAALVGLAWLGALAGLWRGGRPATFLSLNVLLFAPFLLNVADRGLSLRDLLPLVYLSYVALGGLAGWLVAKGQRMDGAMATGSMRKAALLVIVAVVSLVLVPRIDSVTRQTDIVYPDDWQNPLARDIAAWLDDYLTPGTGIMSTRLYYSQVYFLSDGQFPIHQLPTVEVDIDPAGEIPLKRRSTLFRWENDRLPLDGADDQWLYLTRYPHKGYFIALAERDLLDDLRSRDVEFVLLTTPDAGFSSPSMVAYFDAHPAFRLEQHLRGARSGEARIYSLDASKLGPLEQPMRITRPAHEYLSAFGEGGIEALVLRMNRNGALITDE